VLARGDDVAITLARGRIGATVTRTASGEGHEDER